MMSYGSPGVGTFTNLAGEMFKQLADTPDVTRIPYKGAGLIAAGLDPALDTPAAAQRFVDAERTRLIPLVKSTGFKLG